MHEDQVEQGAIEQVAARLDNVAGLLEAVLEKMASRELEVAAAAEDRIGRIVATVDASREAELMERLSAAEATIAELQARAAESAARAVQAPARKTVPAGLVAMLSKQGVALDSVEAGAVDAALTSLSIEQRIAVKAELLRAGLLG